MPLSKLSPREPAALEAEIALALADRSLPIETRSELERRIEAIRVKAGVPDPPCDIHLREEVDACVANTLQRLDDTAEQLERSRELTTPVQAAVVAASRGRGHSRPFVLLAATRRLA